MTWLVEHSRLRGREWIPKVAIPPFGEAVEYLKRGHKFEAQGTKGMFLGVKDNATEKIVGAATGVYTVQSQSEESLKTIDMTQRC